MHKLVKMRAIFAWLVLLSILFSGLVPAMSHAMAAATQPDEEVQVCTMEGMKTIVIKDSSGKPGPSEHMLKHCPYCAVHASPNLPPPPAPFAFAAPEASSFLPRLFYQSATPLFAWTPASPRGPPSRHP